MRWLTVVVILLTVLCDSFRDTVGTQDWWVYHLWKWAAFYPALLLLLWREWPLSKVRYRPGNALIWLGLAVAGWLLWRIGPLVAGKNWGSVWLF